MIGSGTGKGRASSVGRSVRRRRSYLPPAPTQVPQGDRSAHRAGGAGAGEGGPPLLLPHCADPRELDRGGGPPSRPPAPPSFSRRCLGHLVEVRLHRDLGSFRATDGVANTSQFPLLLRWPVKLRFCRLSISPRPAPVKQIDAVNARGRRSRDQRPASPFRQLFELLGSRNITPPGSQGRPDRGRGHSRQLAGRRLPPCA